MPTKVEINDSNLIENKYTIDITGKSQVLVVVNAPTIPTIHIQNQNNETHATVDVTGDPANIMIENCSVGTVCAPACDITFVEILVDGEISGNSVRARKCTSKGQLYAETLHANQFDGAIQVRNGRVVNSQISCLTHSGAVTLQGDTVVSELRPIRRDKADNPILLIEGTQVTIRPQKTK